MADEPIAAAEPAAPAAPEDQGGVTPDADSEPTTLAEHEAQYGRDPSPTAERLAAEQAARDADPDAAPRDAQGRFRQRHHSISQQAEPDDVATIGSLTKRIKEAEAKHGASITQQPGESNRVFELRRRAELAERHAAPAAPLAATRPAPAAAPPVMPPAAPVAAAAAPVKPDPEAFAYGTSDPAYLEALAEWKVDVRLAAREADARAAQTAAERKAEGERIATAWRASITAAKTKYADFEAVALNPQAVIPPILARGTLGEAFVFEDPTGADVLYHLLTHPEEAERLGAHVANPMALFRELTLLGQRLTVSSPTPAATTGSAARLAPPPAPRPPNPVRTGPIRPADSPYSEEGTLADHERFVTQHTRRR